MSPGQLGHTGQGGDQIVQRPRDDDAVVDVEPEHDGHRGVPHPLQTWRSWLRECQLSVRCLDLENWHELAHHGAASSAQVLTSRHLLEEDGDTTGEHRDKIDEEKSSCNGGGEDLL